MSKSILTHEYLKSILHYSIITGQFSYIKKRGNLKSNSIAGSQHMGYIRLKVNRRCYLAHRLAWFWVTGEWPEQEIDHKNGVKEANYWLNLREATHSQNMHNRGLNSDNASGYKGVYWHKAKRKWMAHIKLNKKMKYLGLFNDVQSAYAARIKAEQSMHGDFSRVAINQ